MTPARDPAEVRAPGEVRYRQLADGFVHRDSATASSHEWCRSGNSAGVNKLLKGIAAGAAGTTALNAVTYLDMVLRARPASSTPDDTVRKAEELTGVALSQDGPDSDSAANRRSGLGALLGIATGLGTGAVYGLLRPYLPAPLVLLGVGAGLAANVGSTAPMVALRITDPRSWSPGSWVSDIAPHLAYGFATAAVFEGLLGRGR